MLPSVDPKYTFPFAETAGEFLTSPLVENFHLDDPSDWLML